MVVVKEAASIVSARCGKACLVAGPCKANGEDWLLAKDGSVIDGLSGERRNTHSHVRYRADTPSVSRFRPLVTRVIQLVSCMQVAG
jgi:hypothetical protein